MPLLFSVFIHEDSFVRVIKFLVEVKLFLSELSDQVQQVCIVLSLSCKLPLRQIKIVFSILNHLDTSPFGLFKLVCKLHDYGGRSTNFKTVKVDEITKSKHLPFIVFSFSLFTNLFILFNFPLLRLRVSKVFLVLLFQSQELLVELALTVDELQELGPCEQDRFAQITWHEITSPVFLVLQHFSLLFDETLVVITFSLSSLTYFGHLLFSFSISHLLPFFNRLLVSDQVLDLLNFENDRNLELVKL